MFAYLSPNVNTTRTSWYLNNVQNRIRGSCVFLEAKNLSIYLRHQ